MIKSSGLPRRIDHLGRIVIPVELRRLLGINAGDELEIAVKEDAITLTKMQEACVFCGATESLVSFRDRYACSPCLSEASSRL